MTNFAQDFFYYKKPRFFIAAVFSFYVEPIKARKQKEIGFQERIKNRNYEQE